MELDLEAYQEDIDFFSGECSDTVFLVAHEQSGRDVEIDVFRNLFSALGFAKELVQEYSGGNYEELSPDRDCALLFRYKTENYVYVMEKCIR